MMCCLSCAKADRCEQADRVEDYCINYEERPMTNADRIRAMSDEELAEFLSEYRCVHKAPHCRDANCTQCWLVWLKSPVEVDNG